MILHYRENEVGPLLLLMTIMLLARYQSVSWASYSSVRGSNFFAIGRVLFSLKKPRPGRLTGPPKKNRAVKKI